MTYKSIEFSFACVEHPDLVDAGWEATQLYIWLWLISAEHTLEGVFWGGHASPRWIARQWRLPPKLASGQTAEEFVSAGLERLHATGILEKVEDGFQLTWPEQSCNSDWPHLKSGGEGTGGNTP